MLDVVSPNKCGACGSTLLVYYAVVASILDTCGWKSVQHKILRCGSGRCPRMGRGVGYNFWNRCRWSQWMFQWSADTDI